MPGQSGYEAITLERGVTHDVAFERWANKVWDYANTTRDDQRGAAGNGRERQRRGDPEPES